MLYFFKEKAIKNAIRNWDGEKFISYLNRNKESKKKFAERYFLFAIECMAFNIIKIILDLGFDLTKCYDKHGYGALQICCKISYSIGHDLHLTDEKSIQHIYSKNLFAVNQRLTIDINDYLLQLINILLIRNFSPNYQRKQDASAIHLATSSYVDVRILGNLIKKEGYKGNFPSNWYKMNLHQLDLFIKYSSSPIASEILAHRNELKEYYDNKTNEE